MSVIFDVKDPQAALVIKHNLLLCCDRWLQQVNFFNELLCFNEDPLSQKCSDM